MIFFSGRYILAGADELLLWRMVSRCDWSPGACGIQLGIRYCRKLSFSKMTLIFNNLTFRINNTEIIIPFRDTVACNYRNLNVSGTDKIMDNIEEMCGFRLRIHWIICWKFIAPLILIVSV